MITAPGFVSPVECPHPHVSVGENEAWCIQCGAAVDAELPRDLRAGVIVERPERDLLGHPLPPEILAWALSTPGPKWLGGVFLAPTPECDHAFSDGHHGRRSVRCDRCGSAACPTCNGSGQSHIEGPCPACAGRRVEVSAPTA